MAIRVIVDSTADYTSKELEKRGIVCVPMTVTFGEEQFLDGVDISREEFYERLIEGKDFPKTSQPSPALFADYFAQAKEAGDSVIAILVSGSLSGTLQSAVLAKNMTEYDDIYIVDSKSVTLGIRILADQALVMARQGMSAPQIAAKLEELKSRIRIYAGLDTLEYLQRGGRLSKTAANIGRLVNIKPIVTVDTEGNVVMCGKQMGFKHVCRQISKLMEDARPDMNYPVYYVYSHDKKNCAALVQYLQKNEWNLGEPKLREVGPTIGTHVGPGVYGIVYVEEA